jgi:predicted O-methyltransferase YrrM
MNLPILQFTTQFNWQEILNHWVPGDPYQPEPQTENYYRTKFAVAEFLKPKTLCEIGVRAGYSLAAFLQAGTIEKYIGIDYNQGTEGGVVNYVYYAKQMLTRHNIHSNIYVGMDSQQLQYLPDGPFDLLHVDGDHTAKGAYHDIALGMKSARWILVDDIDFIPPVAEGTYAAIRDFNVKEAYLVPDFGYRGNILIKNPLW